MSHVLWCSFYTLDFLPPPALQPVAHYSLSGHVVPHERYAELSLPVPLIASRPVSLGYRRTKCQQTQPVPFSFCPRLFLLPFALVPCSTVTGQDGAISESPSGCNIWNSLAHSFSHGCLELFASSGSLPPHFLPTDG